MKCSCESKKLLDFGCGCGAFEYEISDHIWCNGIIYAIARTEIEAASLCEDYLSTFDDFDPDWLSGDGWGVIPDNEELPLVIEDDSDDEEVRLASEWIKYYGPGFLAVV